MFHARFSFHGGIRFRPLRQLKAESGGLAVEWRIGISIGVNAGGFAISPGAAMAEREVDRDPEQPRIQRRFAFKF